MKQINPKRLRAWEILLHCEQINEVLWHSDHDDDHPEWKTNWVAGVALLRTVGHVLDKVDKNQSEKLAIIIQKYWREWQLNREENTIFWDFIENERNGLLKEYKFGVEPTPIILVSSDDEVAGDLSEYVSELIHERSGEHGPSLFSEAIDWWQVQLKNIELEWIEIKNETQTN